MCMNLDCHQDCVNHSLFPLPTHTMKELENLTPFENCNALSAWVLWRVVDSFINCDWSSSILWDKRDLFDGLMNSTYETACTVVPFCFTLLDTQVLYGLFFYFFSTFGLWPWVKISTYKYLVSIMFYIVNLYYDGLIYTCFQSVLLISYTLHTMLLYFQAPRWCLGISQNYYRGQFLWR